MWKHGPSRCRAYGRPRTSGRDRCDGLATGLGVRDAQLQQAVGQGRRHGLPGPGRLEASGGVNLETVRLIAETGVERISVGSLTHSSPALDLGFDWPWNRQIRH